MSLGRAGEVNDSERKGIYFMEAICVALRSA